jgi:hypothetical protein
MKEGLYKMIPKQEMDELKIRHDFHKTLHYKMREFIVDKGLESEFYDEYLPEVDDLTRECLESIERAKKLLNKE